MVRCFLAIELPDGIRDYLYNLIIQLKKELKEKRIKTKINWVAKKNLHLTLKFFGDVNEREIKDIRGTIKGVKAERLNLSLDGFGVFPQEDYIRVLWIGLEPEEKIIKLQQHLDETLLSLFPKEQRFSSHLTLGRVKFLSDKKAFLRLLKGFEIKRLEFEIDGFCLFESELTKDGPRYKVLEKYASGQ